MKSYYAPRARIIPLDDGLCLVYAAGFSKLITVDRRFLALLPLCRGCKPIDDHAAAIARSNTTSDWTTIRRALDGLVHFGLLRQARGSAPRNDTTGPHDVRNVGIVTADRPKYLARALRSVIAHADRFGLRLKIIVVDGSSHKQSRTDNRVSLEQELASGHSTMYVGPEEAERLKSRLVRSGFDPALLTFAMTPGDIGSNRNLLLLLTAGDDILMIDDDVLCNIWALPERTDRLTVHGHGDIRAQAFFEARIKALSAASRVDANLFTGHASLLGKQLHTLIDNAADPDLSEACGHELSVLDEESDDLTIRVTMAGLAGDSAVHCPYPLLFGAGPMQARLNSDEALLRLALASRETYRIARAPLITHDAGCMAYCTGLSNRGTLPPFIPIGRNEDGTFGVMLTFVEPAALFAHLTLGIMHDSNRAAEYGARIASATETRLCDVTQAIVRSATVRMPMDSRWRMRLVADAFATVGRLPLPDLREYVTHAVLDVHSRRLAFQQQEEARAAASCAWREAVARYQSQFVEHVATPGFFLPIEFHGVGTVDDGLKRLKLFITRFGELLDVWPSVFEYCASQRWS